MTFHLAPLDAAHYAAILDAAPITPRDSARDGGVALILTDAQEGRCADCGDAATLEFAHIARSAGRMTSDGTVLGAMTCRDCNVIHTHVLAVSGLAPTDPLPYAYARRLYVMSPGTITRADAARAWKSREIVDYRAEAIARLAE